MKLLDRIMRRLGYVTHQDKAIRTELWRQYGGQRIATRRWPQSDVDVGVGMVNANVAICLRAIGQAVRSLPLRIVSIENVNNVETEIPDMDHEANELIKHPNPEQTLREILKHNVISKLADGNAYNTIEVMTGPNARIEIWPRDPRLVEVMLEGGKPGPYRIGKGGRTTLIYKRSRVVHIKDLDITNQIYGKPRHEAVRDEIMLDNVVNTFNKKFFQSGAALHLMFTPKANLSEAQHEQILEAIATETGVDKSFGLFINRFAGKLETADMKHKDIAFLEMLKHNREKIFGQYGLPPFRGGVMEFANYANAVAQDKDFWLNTVKPEMDELLDAFNKQLIWPFFGDDVALRADYSGVEALKGDKKAQAEVHKIYIDSGVLTEDEVREEIGRDPLPEEEKRKRLPAPSDDDDGKTEPDDEEKDKEAKPTQEEENELTYKIYGGLRAQRRQVLQAIAQFSVNGRLMSRFCNAVRECERFLPIESTNRELHTRCLPLVQGYIGAWGARQYRANGCFKANTRDAARATRLVRMTLSECNAETRALMEHMLHHCDVDNWDYRTLHRQLGRLFTLERARAYAKIIIYDTKNQVDTIVYKQRCDATKRYLNGKTKKEVAA